MSVVMSFSKDQPILDMLPCNGFSSSTVPLKFLISSCMKMTPAIRTTLAPTKKTMTPITNRRLYTGSLCLVVCGSDRGAGEDIAQIILDFSGKAAIVFDPCVKLF